MKRDDKREREGEKRERERESNMSFGYAYWSKNSSSRFFFVNANTVIRFCYVDIPLKTKKNRALTTNVLSKKLEIKHRKSSMVDTYTNRHPFIRRRRAHRDNDDDDEF
jgi:hypothetical protein